MNNTFSKGDKVSFQSEKSGTLTGRVNNILENNVVFIAVRRTRDSFGGYFRIPADKVTLVQKKDALVHSDKGLDTLAAMKTVASDWGLTEIKWVIKTIDRQVYVACPKCQGEGAVYTFKGKTLTAKALRAIAEFGSYSHEANWIAGGAVAKECDCPWLKPRQIGYEMWAGVLKGRTETSFYSHFSRYDRGLVRAVRPVVTEVGIPQWHKDTQFDSRFAYRHGATSGHKECELCAKAIPSHRFVPVTGKGRDGKIHGAWIGEDCARKFFGIKNFKKEQVIERQESAK